MTGQEVLRRVRRNWWIVTVAVCVGALAMFALSATVTPTYTASARVFVSVASSRGASDLSQGATFVQSQVASYADLAASPFVLDPVAKRMGVPGQAEELSKVVTASSSKETVLIDITASDPDADRSATLAKAVADELGAAVTRLAPRDSEGRPMVQVVTVALSGSPSLPSMPRTRRNMIFGGLAGGLLAVVGIATIRLRRPAVEDERDSSEANAGRSAAVSDDPSGRTPTNVA